ncbi:F-actin-monooxygenase Mical isoform X2 [Adelges cooleyi]|uniref:F-actin-monooxygenase Mical isoform X2 n=1 Tax=Adelges cooleyi TaxID=133065 RepID=UPI00217FA79F|nr:F-actin-monooxygenase Mical isoform X2 [Adelges cooleyi]
MASHYRKSLPTADAALASDIFDRFCTASTMKTILGHFRHLCEILRIKPTNFPQFYPKLRTMLCSWKAKALWNKFDKKASHKCYNRGKACMNTRVLIIGSGPCGLRAAIEAQLLGAKVVVIEKRDRLSRHNVLHLWPFVIQDLKSLGAKKFFGKFCAGAIDHISIRQLQCILLKVSLILGVEIHEGVSFESLSPPPDNDEKIGWRAIFSPENHPVSQYEFDVLIGADGKRNTLEGFKRKEFRGRLAIAITANFINKHTEAEARVEEISGVAFIFNQKFFKDLYHETGIDLENIVYYKDETHYFVMTAKKHSLIDKGVILNDYADVAKLLALENINKEALTEYAREAANFSTHYSLPQLEFALNHYGQPDVAMFDFTSMYAAENSSHVMQRNGHKLLTTLVGDSLLEPFWPTGSGCARGFLSSMDACWAIRHWGAPDSNPLDVLAERESIYHILGQTTPENLQRNIAGYTLDPYTRYPNLNTHAVVPVQVVNLFDCDDKTVVEKFLKAPRQAPNPIQDVPKKRRRKESQVHQDTLLVWLKTQLDTYDSISVDDFAKSFKNGLALCAIIHRYRPDLVDFFSLSSTDSAKNNQLAFDILEHEFGIPPIMSGTEMEQCDVPDVLAMLSYLSQVYDTFRREIPHIKHPKLEESDHGPSPIASRFRFPITKNNMFLPYSKLAVQTKPNTLSRKRSGVNNISAIDKSTASLQRRYRKRRTNINNGSLVQIKKKLNLRMHQVFKKEPEPDELLDNDNHEEFKERARELERKLFPSPRDSRVQREASPRYKMEEDISVRAKEIEAKLKGGLASDKKPKDLYRAIGKIDKSDWNVKEIERKIEENKAYVKHDKNGTEKVPKWSRPQYDDKVSAIKKKLHVKGYENDDNNKKYLEIDKNLNKLNRKIKDGNILDQGQRGANKVSAMAAHLATINKQPENTHLQRSGTKNTVILPQRGSETCHFCKSRVYLMERLSAEGRFFHRGCFRCEYCQTTLRLGTYMFDREGKYNNRFYCSQHFGLPGTQQTRSRRKYEQNKTEPDMGIKPIILDKTPEKIKASMESLDRGETPERVEFENLDLEEDLAHSEMDEDEWTDRNFGASANEMLSSDELSEFSDSDSDEIPNPDINTQNKEQKLLTSTENDNLSNNNIEDDGLSSQNESDESQDRFSYKEFDSGDDESDTATEGEEEVKAREMRKQEVCLRIPDISVATTDTGSETEVATDYYSSSSGNNSATEISTDSEFERDDKTPTRHSIPNIIVSESVHLKRISVEEAKVDPLVPENPKIAEIVNRVSQNRPNFTPFAKPGYELNRTQSTEGIATKRSLELKKLYLLAGNDNGLAVKKSGSTATLDTKFKSFVDHISEHQKMLNPAPVPSLVMQAFLQNASPIINKSEKKSKELPDSADVFQHVCQINSDKTNNDNEMNHNNKDTIVNNVKSSHDNDNNEARPRSPAHETSIIVPEFHRISDVKKMDTDSLSTNTSSSSSDDDKDDQKEVRNAVNENETPYKENHSLPKLEIHNSRGELMDDLVDLTPLQPKDQQEPSKIECKPIYAENGFNKIITVPSPMKNKNAWNGEVLKHVSTTADLCGTNSMTVNPNHNDISASPPLESLLCVGANKLSGGNVDDDDEDHTFGAHTETELSDWARDDDVGVSEAWDEFVPVPIQSVTYRKHQRPNSKRKPRNLPKIKPAENTDEYGHVCGKIDSDHIEFMDTISDSDGDHVAALNQTLLQNTGYVEFVSNPQTDDELKTPVIETMNAFYGGRMVLDKEDYDTTTTSDAVTVMDVKNDNEDTLTHVAADTNKTYQEYVHRLQEKITPFNNIRDSIDIRKTKKPLFDKAAGSYPVVANETAKEHYSEPIEQNSTTYKIQQITKERMKEKNLVHDMVMSKIPGKSPNERKQRRNRSSPFSQEPAAVDHFEFTKPLPVYQCASELKARPVSLFIPTKSPKSEQKPANNGANKPILCSEAFSLPDIRRALFEEKGPALSVAEILKSTEEIRENARARARLKSDSELGISPEDKIRQLREKLERRRAVKSECDGLSTLTKSRSCQSIDDYNLDLPMCETPKRIDQRKDDRPERKRSITQAVMAAIFQKKTQSPNKNRSSSSQQTSPSRFKFLMSGKSKEKSQSADNIVSLIGDHDKKMISAIGDKPVQYKSNSESEIRRRLIDSLAPPVPPLPTCYSIDNQKSLETIITDDEPKNGIFDNDPSMMSADSRMTKSEMKIARQSQRKRLRIAQEVQRKLEELDVKLKMLEAEGVEVEKRLRGEGNEENEDEPSLLHTYCELMSEVNRLRREERELGLQAQELELEDNLARRDNVNSSEFGYNFNYLASIQHTNHAISITNYTLILLTFFPLYVFIITWYLVFPNLFT